LNAAKQLRKIIAKATGAELIFEKSLREKHLGEAQGTTREERSESTAPHNYTNMILKYRRRSWREVEERYVP